MIDKKYTDKDIISSLEVIATTCNCNECKIRSGKWGNCNCSQTTANAALDLINRQKAEIERLKGSVIVNNIMESQKIKREAKFEAVKEFAARLKCGVPQETGVIRCSDIDNLVKEMVGGK